MQHTKTLIFFFSIFFKLYFELKQKYYLKKKHTVIEIIKHRLNTNKEH